jgi:Tol biopolymer transport system component
LSGISRGVSPALDRIVRHCLEKNPEERFQSARDVAFDLQTISGSTSQSAVAIPTPLTTHASARVAAIACVVLASLATGFWAAWSLKPQSSPTFKQLTFRRGTVTAARFTPDGQSIIYSAAWQGSPHPDLFSARADGVLSRPLDVDDADVLAISPQGEMALLQHWRRTGGWERRGMLARVPLSGGASKEILDGVVTADWSNDGANLAVIRSDPRYQLEFPIGHVLVTTSSGWLSDAHIAPDQQHVAFFEHPISGDDRGSVSVVDLKGNKRSLSSGWSSLNGLEWSRSGKEIWFTGSNTGVNSALYAISLSGHLRTVLRVPGQLVLYDISHDGRVLVAKESIRREVMGLTPGSPQERDLTWLDWTQERALTPDGRWFLFDEQGEGGGVNYSIYVRKTDGSPAIRLGDNDAFSISSDGKWVLAVTTNTGAGSILLLPTGPGEPRPIKTGNLVGGLARFLPPDEKRILITTGEPRSYVQLLESDTPRPVTPPRVTARSLTADGNFVLGVDEQNNWALYPVEKGQPIPLTNWTAGDRPMGHTSDNHSFFVRNGDLPANVYRFDFVAGTRQFVRQLQPSDPTGIERISSVLMTPDGRYYVYGVTRQLNDLFIVSGLN